MSRHRLADGDVVEIGGALVTFLIEDGAVDVLRHQPTAAEPAAGGDLARLRVFHELADAVATADAAGMAQLLLTAVLSAWAPSVAWSR